MSGKVRVALAFAAIFFALGMHMPYFPIWLQSEGYSAGAIGVVLGLITWMRAAANPLVGRLSDRLGSVKTPALALSVCAAVSYASFGLTSSLWQVIAVGVVLGFSFGPLVPLVDSVALRLGSEGAVNYGQLRLFGSLAFILASNVGGWLLETGSESDVLRALQIAAVVVVVAIALLPRRGPGQPRAAKRAAPRRSHLTFFVTTGLLHASHAVLYAFGTAHWRACGVADSTIGPLWSLGVVAEVVLFAASGTVQKKLGSSSLLALAAVGGLLRWPLLGLTAEVPVLFGIQILHGLTFGALHLGAIAYVQERVDHRATATVTSLYAASSGIGSGVMMLVAGSLYASLAGHAYFVMAGLSAAGLAGAWIVAHPRDATD